MYRIRKEVLIFLTPSILIPIRSTFYILLLRPLTVLYIFIEDIIVLTKYCRIFLVLLSVVVKRGEGKSARLVVKPIFRA
jgi:hypothetical protein